MLDWRRHIHWTKKTCRPEVFLTWICPIQHCTWNWYDKHVKISCHAMLSIHVENTLALRGVKKKKKIVTVPRFWTHTFRFVVVFFNACAKHASCQSSAKTQSCSSFFVGNVKRVRIVWQALHFEVWHFWVDQVSDHFNLSIQFFSVYTLNIDYWIQ